MPEKDREEIKSSVWRHRGRRFATGLNVCVAVVLAGTLLAMVNYLAYRHRPVRVELSEQSFFGLSGKTQTLIAGLESDVKVVVFFRQSHFILDSVRHLLKEYEYESAENGKSHLSVEFVDPNRDLARTKELKQIYKIEQADIVVFECEGRRKYVDVVDIVETTKEVDLSQVLAGGKKTIKKKTLFKGETAFSSAIENVVQASRPVICFLTGHGEREINEYGKQVSYSGIARLIRRDEMEVRSLNLAEQRKIPADCTALVIAGPDRKLSSSEVDIISGFLAKNGRLFVLIDPATITGLEGLLESWGVKLRRDVVVGGLTLTGRELVITDYGDHPITKHFSRINTMFYMPRSVEAVYRRSPGAKVQADRPCVTILASTSKDGWAEYNLNESPSRFDEGVDRPGPIPVAAAVERGSVSGIDVELKPTRIVVIGDSSFVSNGALKGGIGGNADLFMSALNWLVERESLMSIAPKMPDLIDLGLAQGQMRNVSLVVILLVPGIVMLLGIGVWFMRRS
jgi:hypothetical protein